MLPDHSANHAPPLASPKVTVFPMVVPLTGTFDSAYSVSDPFAGSITAILFPKCSLTHTEVPFASTKYGSVVTGSIGDVGGLGSMTSSSRRSCSSRRSSEPWRATHSAPSASSDAGRAVSICPPRSSGEKSVEVERVDAARHRPLPHYGRVVARGRVREDDLCRLGGRPAGHGVLSEGAVGAQLSDLP